jgi:hypothetical protein
VTTPTPTLAELRDEFRSDAIRRAIDMAKACDAAARDVLARDAERDRVRNPFDVALAACAAAQAWAAVAALLAPNGAKD